MELVQWRPVNQELSVFRNKVDKLWNSYFGETPAVEPTPEQWFPFMDFSEIENAFVVKVELPGVEIDDVHVYICGDLLTIKGQKIKKDKGPDEFCYSTERYYGSFKRIFQLPASVRVREIRATLDKGVLKVVLPKTGTAANKEVQIEVTPDESA
jgi:HSP20 family protein